MSSEVGDLTGRQGYGGCSVAKLCLTLCDPMGCSTPGFPVLHYLPELAQIHQMGDVAQSPPLLPSSPSLLAFNFS